MTLIHKHAECGHIFTTYILPDLFHFAAFIIGFIYFRVTEGEPLYSLMEKVSADPPSPVTVPYRRCSSMPTKTFVCSVSIAPSDD